MKKNMRRGFCLMLLRPHINPNIITRMEKVMPKGAVPPSSTIEKNEKP